MIAPPNQGSSFARYLHKYETIRWLLSEKSGKQLMTTALNGFEEIGNFPKEMPVMVIAGLPVEEDANVFSTDGLILQETQAGAEYQFNFRKIQVVSV